MLDNSSQSSRNQVIELRRLSTSPGEMHEPNIKKVQMLARQMVLDCLTAEHSTEIGTVCLGRMRGADSARDGGSSGITQWIIALLHSPNRSRNRLPSRPRPILFLPQLLVMITRDSFTWIVNLV
jgi:hypothetical protein